jgi:hypothetical protein
MRRFIILTAAIMLTLVGNLDAAKKKAMSDKDIIALCLVLEAGGEGYRGMEAIMHVINNRADGDPKKWKSVVLKPKHFSCFNGSNRYNLPGLMAKAKTLRSGGYSVWNQAKYIVDTIHNSIDITKGATHYHASNMRRYPKWASPYNRTTIINRHIFYRI